mgnify:CR=1 FL=1
MTFVLFDGLTVVDVSSEGAGSSHTAGYIHDWRLDCSSVRDLAVESLYFPGLHGCLFRLPLGGAA